MITDWITLMPWGDFPDPIENRCDLIAQHVEVSGWHAVRKWNGSYSFEGLIEGDRRTVAKLVPQFDHSAAIILAAFSSFMPRAEEFARRFDWRGTGTIMHEPFLLGHIPDERRVDEVAAIMGEFLSQVPSAGRRPVSL